MMPSERLNTGEAEYSYFTGEEVRIDLSKSVRPYTVEKVPGVSYFSRVQGK